MASYKLHHKIINKVVPNFTLRIFSQVNLSMYDIIVWFCCITIKQGTGTADTGSRGQLCGCTYLRVGHGVVPPEDPGGDEVRDHNVDAVVLVPDQDAEDP